MAKKNAGDSPARDPLPRGLEQLAHSKLDDKATVSQKRKLRKRVVFTYMRRRTWNKARCVELAEAWNLSVDAVQRYACEASEKLRERDRGRDEYRALSLEQLDYIVAEAIDSPDRRDRRTAVRAIAERNRMVGTHHPVRVVLTREEALLQALTPEEQESFVETGALPDDIDARAAVTASAGLNGSGAH